MRRVGQARRRDANEGDIVKALQKLGVIVLRISAKGVPDLLCWHAYTGLFLLEVKTGKGKLTPAQVDTSAAVPFHVARTTAEAVEVFMSEWKTGTWNATEPWR